MRTKDEIRGRAQALLEKRLRQRMEEYLSKRPKNCVFNTTFRVKDQGKVGFCQNQDVLSSLKTSVFVCNQECTSKRCTRFQCRNTGESVKSDFQEILSSPAQCGERYPKLATLLWVIQDYQSVGRFRRFGRAFRGAFSSFYRLITLRWW